MSAPADLQAAGHSSFVLLALGLEDEAAAAPGGTSISALAQRLGMARSVVRGHLQRLRAAGLVTALPRGGWKLTGRSRALLLACSGLEPSAPPAAPNRASGGRAANASHAPAARPLSDGAPAGRASPAPARGAGRASPTLPPDPKCAAGGAASTTESINPSQEEARAEARSATRRKRPSAAERRVRANLDAFRSEGVGQNRRVLELCSRAYVTPAYIHALAANLHREHRYLPGVLIYAVDQHDPLPRDERDGQAYIDSLRAFGLEP